MNEESGYIPPIEETSTERTAEKKDVTFAETAKFIKEKWQRVFHIHPRERGKLLHVTTKHDAREAVALALSPQFLNLSGIGLSPHQEKAYSEEIVLPHLKEKFANERGLTEQKAEKRARQIEYHTSKDIKKTHRTAEKVATGLGKEFLKGAEVDVVIGFDNQGFLQISLRTPIETLSEEKLDYLIVSLHPETDPYLEFIAKKNPRALLKIYKQIFELNNQYNRTQSGLPPIIVGHPGRNCPAFRRWNSAQKEEFVRAASENGVILEISANDYYFTPSKNQSPSRRKEFMQEKIPIMDPEILAFIAKHQVFVVIETDLHYGDWADKFRDKFGGNPLKFVLENIREKGFLEMYHQFKEVFADVISDEKRRSKLAKELPVMIGNFIRVVKIVREAGIADEQILNTVDRGKLPF